MAFAAQLILSLILACVSLWAAWATFRTWMLCAAFGGGIKGKDWVPFSLFAFICAGSAYFACLFFPFTLEIKP